MPLRAVRGPWDERGLFGRWREKIIITGVGACIMVAFELFRALLDLVVVSAEPICFMCEE